ncbi:MAG: rhomboid family intramembrane serine protease [Pseudomonadota bacterium]
MQSPYRQDTFPPAIFAILLSCACIFVLGETTSLGRFAGSLALWTYLPYFRPWQPLTYGFVHADWAHLAFNMFALWMFGRSLEYRWGTGRFASYYLVCVLGGAIGQFALSFATGQPLPPMVGASGGVFGVLLAFGMTFPNQRIVLLIPPIPMKAKYMVLLFGLLELYLGFTGRQTGVAHFAHLGGMVVGLMLLLYWRSQKPRRRF